MLLGGSCLFIEYGVDCTGSIIDDKSQSEIGSGGYGSVDRAACVLEGAIAFGASLYDTGAIAYFYDGSFDFNVVSTVFFFELVDVIEWMGDVSFFYGIFCEFF